MRDLLLLGTVVVVCAAALLRPRWGLYGYIWFALMRPDVLAWTYGRNRYSFAMAVCMFVGAARYLLPAPIDWLRNPITRLLVFLQVPIAISLVVHPSVAPGTYSLFLRTIATSLLVPVLIKNEKHLREFIAVMAFSVGVIGAKFGLFGVMHGGVRFGVGYGGLMGDNTTLGHALAMAVPLCWYARDLFKPWWSRFGFLLMALLALATVPMTYSRGAAVALGAALVLMAMRLRRKAALIPLVALIVIVLGLAGSAYMDRLATIAAPTQEASAQSRLVLFKAAFKMWLDYPWFGVGFGRENQMALLSRYLPPEHQYEPKVIHNAYLQILVDSGIFAFLLYVALFVGTIIWLQIASRGTKERSTLAICYSLQTALVASFAAGLTMSRVEFDLNYYIMMAAAAWLAIRRASRTTVVRPSYSVAAAGREQALGPVQQALKTARPPVATAPPVWPARLRRPD